MTAEYGVPSHKSVSAEILELLTVFGRAPSSRLTDAVREGNQHASVRPRTDRQRKLLDTFGRGLTECLGREITLYRLTPKQAPRSTAECERLGEALERVRRIRKAAEEEAERRRVLEWLQVSTVLDSHVLTIGAYQAHIERFLGAAVQELHEHFPWIATELRPFVARVRTKGGAGQLRKAFDDGDVDYMLTPTPPTKAWPSVECYAYGLRLVGSPDLLAKVCGRRQESVDDGRRPDSVDVRALRGRTLIAAPPGFSSRERLEELFAGQAELGPILAEPNPLLIRVRALAGEALGVLSDEYTSVGRPELGYPLLSAANKKHRVPMYMSARPGLERGVHAAFRFVVQQLADREKTAARAAALD
jgi:hypothetical protein